MNFNIFKTYVSENKDAPQKGFQPIMKYRQWILRWSSQFCKTIFFLQKQMIFYVIICISFVWSFVKQIIDDLCLA